MKKDLRIKRHLKIRKKVAGTINKPRLAVFRSNRHIYAQIIDDQAGRTLVAATDIKLEKGAKAKKAYEVGMELAKKAQKHKIKEVVFDRGGFLYHGRILEVAKGAREGGLEF